MDLLAVQAYLPGGDGFLPRSLFSLECPFFRDSQGAMNMDAAAKYKRMRLINESSLHPAHAL